MLRVFKMAMVAAAAAVMTVATVWSSQPASAQGGQPTALSANVQAFNACTTTNYADLVSKTLGMSAAELRKAIVSGQSLQDIAKSKNVDIQTVMTAIQAARKAEAAQAVKDGLITQAEATAMESVGAGGAGPAGTPPAAGAPPQGGQRGGQQGGGQQGNNPPQGGRQGDPQTAAQAPLPDIGNLSFLLQANTNTSTAAGQRMGGLGSSDLFNVVNPYSVAAQALNMKCTDLVKSLVGTAGKSIAAVATTQKVEAKTVTDALSKAYKDALAQDVTNGIITQAQSDQVSGNVDKAVATFFNSTNVMRMRPMMP